MGLAKNFDNQLQQELKINAAWLPVANSLRVGTYGVVEGGVLRPIGHIHDDFGVKVGETETSLAAENVSFQSEGVRTIRTVAGAKVEAFPKVGELDAELSFEFSKSNSVLVKMVALHEERMTSVQRVANELATKEDWKRFRFRVVSAVFRADAPVILLASEANTTFKFSGKVAALKGIEGGSAKGEFSWNAADKKGFQIAGKRGIIGLSLFRLRIGGALKILADSATNDALIDAGLALEDDV